MPQLVHVERIGIHVPAASQVAPNRVEADCVVLAVRAAAAVHAVHQEIEADDFETLRESLQKLKLNDASISYMPESSGALGFGFRCGFLGLLHMEIVKERLEREFNLSLIATAPSVQYQVTKTDGSVEIVDNPSELPPTVFIKSIQEPYFRVSIITPKEYTGTLMDLCQTRRGELGKLEYLSPERVELHYLMPLAEVVVDFFDQMKSRSQGYASLDYELDGYRESDLVRGCLHWVVPAGESRWVRWYLPDVGFLRRRASIHW